MMRRARLLGRDARGHRVYRVPVRMVYANSRGTVSEWLNPRTVDMSVIAYSAADAANWAIEQAGPVPEVTVYAYGPAGGETRRYQGWQSAIGRAMWDGPRGQGSLL